MHHNFQYATEHFQQALEKRSSNFPSLKGVVIQIWCCTKGACLVPLACSQGVKPNPKPKTASKPEFWPELNPNLNQYSWNVLEPEQSLNWKKINIGYRFRTKWSKQLQWHDLPAPPRCCDWSCPYSALAFTGLFMTRFLLTIIPSFSAALA